ncbi:MAG TPA: DNA-processing protein DprA [Erysipelotrichaceae bacterium]|nr:DNA-processing protein DprA [Erysipelotrichaceae bacterium]
MRNLLISLAIKYQGDYFKIEKAIKNNEKASNIELQQALTILDKKYPKQLLDLEYPPFVLFYQGDIGLLDNDLVAVVGSRKNSTYGRKCTIDIVERLNNRYVIVSGLAKGIDSIAHRYAKKTIAVLGNGLNYYYPLENKNLYEDLQKNQLIISEYPFDVKPRKYHFPFRNRIIAALCKDIIVTEASYRSGTMITVNEALALNRNIYAVPYCYDEETNCGTNILIQQGANILTKENINDLFDKI